MPTPVIPFERDERGLLKHFPYPFKPDGAVDWRACLRPEHLYVNPDYEEQLKMQFNVKSRRDIDVTQCEDKQLLVLLEGWKYLCYLRGLKRQVPVHHISTPEYCAVGCETEFIPNFENPYGLTIGDMGSASIYSVGGSFQLHLAAMAYNRALARSVRTALRVPIYGKDEFDADANKRFEAALKAGQNPLAGNRVTEEAPKSTPTSFDVYAHLERTCQQLDKNGSHSFEKIRAHAITIASELESDPNEWTEFKSIPRRDASVLLGKINEAAEKKSKKTKGA